METFDSLGVAYGTDFSGQTLSTWFVFGGDNKGLTISHLEKSILIAHPFLTQGLCIRIGNGYSTSIWDNLWISEDGNFKIITQRRPNSFLSYKVADLIDPESGSWHKPLIDATFWGVDRDKILSIPAGSINADDRWVWHYTKDGTFSVKSCYQLMYNSIVSSSSGLPPSTSSSESSFNWKNIWSLNIPPKIRMFIWRACSNILSHSAELFQPHVIPSPFCVHCGVEIEIITHVLMECRDLREVWCSPPFNFPILPINCSMRSIF